MCACVLVGSIGSDTNLCQILKGVHGSEGLRTTGLVDSPHPTEEKADPDRERGLPKGPISGRADWPQVSLLLSWPPWLWGGSVGEETFTPTSLFTQPPAGPAAGPPWGSWWSLSPVWAAQPGAGRSEELPGFAEVAGIDLVLVAGLGRQGEMHKVMEGAGRVLWRH